MIFVCQLEGALALVRSSGSGWVLKACGGNVSWKCCGDNVSLKVVVLFTWCLMDRDELGGLFGDFAFVSSSRGGSVALCLFQSFFCARVQYWLLRTTRWPSLARLSEVWTQIGTIVWSMVVVGAM